MWQNILPCVYGWMNNKWTFGWNIYMKNVICLNVWTTHVYNQRFKGLGIHSKSITPQWATISFPLIDPNKVCLKAFFVIMYLWQAPTNQKENMRLISMWCSPYVNSNLLQCRLLKPKYFVLTILYKFYIFGLKGYKFEVFFWEPNINIF
jgi:hypothetical protein